MLKNSAAVALAFALTIAVAAQASLMGTMVQLSNDVYPEYNQPLVVGDAVELFVCYYAVGENCLLSYQLDIGADYVSQTEVNNTDGSYQVVTNTNTYTFASDVIIAGFEELVSTWPVEWAYSSTAHSLSQTSPSHLWTANSRYDNYVRLFFVPEPGTLPLMLGAITALALMRRRQMLAHFFQKLRAHRPAELVAHVLG